MSAYNRSLTNDSGITGITDIGSHISFGTSPATQSRAVRTAVSEGEDLEGQPQERVVLPAKEKDVTDESDSAEKRETLT